MPKGIPKHEREPLSYPVVNEPEPESWPQRCEFCANNGRASDLADQAESDAHFAQHRAKFNATYPEYVNTWGPPMKCKECAQDGVVVVLNSQADMATHGEIHRQNFLKFRDPPR